MLFFKFPFAEDIYTTDENSAQTAVSFMSFDQSEKVDFQGNIVKISKQQFSNIKIVSENLAALPDFEEETEDEYSCKLQKVITFVQEKALPKLVISRRKAYQFKNSQVSLNQTFLNLSKTYPNAFVYVFIKNEKCWIGAFSELLGRFDKATSRFETMALAGTLPLDEVWTQKEMAEQQPVADYIQEILRKYAAANLEVSETADHVSGNIKHLRTDFKADIYADDLEKIIAELHPTPAVCGIPKDVCSKAIAKFESHPRSFYSGYIKVETAENVQYFVNLRCAEIFSDAAFLYVGGGITADSDPAKEWRETELKAEAILKNISFS